MRIDLEVGSRGGTDSARRFSFDLPCIRLGRGEDCELSVPTDLLLSRRQCSLEWHVGTLFLFPLRGQSDTFLNSSRVSRPLPLSSGDIIEVGGQVVKVLFQQPELSYPSGAERRLTLRVTEPGGSPHTVDCTHAVLRLCQGTASDIYIGEAKQSRLLVSDPVEAVIFWSSAGMPHLLVHKYSAPIERNGEPVVSCTVLTEGDLLTLGGAQIEVREIISPAEPPPPPLGLLIFDGDAPPRWQWFPRSRVEVGAAKGSDIVLADAHLPSLCFAIERRGKKPTLIPTSAQHNLYVNYLRLTAPIELLDGDRISFGELLLHVDLKTPPPAKAQQGERRIVLTMTESSEADNDPNEPREVFLKGESVRLGTTPQSEVDWPTNDELLIDMTVLWHPTGTPFLHVGMWSAEVTLNGQKLRRCTLAPLQIGATIEAAGTTAVLREIVPRPLAQPAQ